MFAVVTSSDFIKIRDLPPTAVRLRPEIKERLAREAAINGRSLHSEILLRLTASLQSSEMVDAQGQATHRAKEPGSEWPLHQSDTERALLSIFRRLSPEKQLALMMLLK